jgi:hypothetical protein
MTNNGVPQDGKQQKEEDQMKATRTINSLIGAALIAVIVSGCATQRQPVTLSPVPDALRYKERVQFAENIDAPWDTTVRNDDDAQEQVVFALSLAARTRHVSAGDFFVQNAVRFESRGQDFEVACLAAAANEYLKAGELTKFRTTVRQLRTAANRYQIAGAGPELSALLSLGDIASGAAKASERTPRALKPLYAPSGSHKTSIAAK